MANSLLLIPLIYLIGVSVQLVVNDFRSHRLPNKYTVPLIAVTFTCLLTAGILLGEYQNLAAALIAMVMTFLIGWLLARYATFGMGDVKLLISLNALLAWHDPWLVLLSLVIGFGVANVWAIFVWIKKKDPREHIALGPFLLLGFAVIGLSPSVELFTAVGESWA